MIARHGLVIGWIDDLEHPFRHANLVQGHPHRIGQLQGTLRTRQGRRQRQQRTREQAQEQASSDEAATSVHCSSVDPTDAALTCKAGKSALAYRQDTQFFDLVTTWQTSTALRMETGQCVAQVVATAGLLLTVLRPPADKASSLFAAYIGAAYWFTASTSFSNPAAVLGRMFSDSFAGIAAVSASSFVVAEIVGASIGVAIAQALQEKA